MKNPALNVLLTAAVLIPAAVYAQPRRDGDTIHLILHFGKTKYFSARGLTGFRHRHPTGKSIWRK